MLDAVRRRLVARGPLRTAVAVSATTVVLAVMVIAESQADPSPQARATRSAGVLSISNSRADRSVLTGRRMLPGDAVAGTVTITNSGSEAGLFELAPADLADTAGQGGGVLSDELRLVVEDVTVAARPAVLYDGTLGGLDVVPVGELGPGADRRFRFTVTRPQGGKAATYRAASTVVDFDWTAVREQSGRCANAILGSDRADVLRGSHQGDTISGGPGADRITGGAGEDCLAGEEGDDFIDARDGGVDEVDCGPGDDTVLADPQDTTRNCEHVLTGAAAAAAAG